MKCVKTEGIVFTLLGIITIWEISDGSHVQLSVFSTWNALPPHFPTSPDPAVFILQVSVSALSSLSHRPRSVISHALIH